MKIRGAARAQLTVVTMLLVVCTGPAPEPVAAAGLPHVPHRHLGGTVREFEWSSVTPDGPIVAGGAGTAHVVINRQGGHIEVVTVSVEPNPQGITGSGSVPEDWDLGTLTIDVPASVTAGSYRLTADATDGVLTISTEFDLSVVASGAAITSFTATPKGISVGQQSTLAYAFSGGTGSIDHGVGAVTSGVSSIVSPAVTTTYTLTVTPPSGPPLQAQATVNVGSVTLFTPRAYHTETLLPNGKVLLAGGRSSSYVASADLYDPTTGLVTLTGSMSTARVSHTATLLANGKVLIAGGFTSGEDAVASAELYNPATGSFTATGSLHYARGTHTATLLPSGEVLVVGGYNGGKDDLASYPAVCELYNPATGQFHDTGSLNTRRGAHRATPIFNASFPAMAAGEVAELAGALEDRVLISAGYAAGILKSLEWYSVTSGSFTPLSVSLATGRALHTAILLPNNKVLFAGGLSSASLPAFGTSSAELYDIATNTIGPTGGMSVARGAHSSTLVGGKVLVCGGVSFISVYNTVESYDPGTGAFTTLVTPMSEVRALHTATLLDNGAILLAGGAYASGFSIAYRNTVELYTPPAP